MAIAVGDLNPRPTAAVDSQWRRIVTPIPVPESIPMIERLRAAEPRSMAGMPPIDGPVELWLDINLQIPASWSKKRQRDAAAGLVAATKKPDADNVLKAVKDGMNGIVWIDDAQAVEYRISKRYSTSPCVQVSVEQLPLQAA